MNGTEDTGRRWHSLDSLRGIAALLVVTFHCAQVSAGFGTRTNPMSLAAWLEPWTWLKYTPLRVLVSSGPSAVVLFFVLSGFVLSLPFLKTERQPGFPSFAVKRICRIYLPFAASILISALLYALVQPKPMPALSPWFNSVIWDQPLSIDYVVRNLAMTGITSDMTLNLVMWSLVHELRISLVFPLLFLLTRRWPGLSMAGSLLLGVVCTEVLAGREADSVLSSFVDTGRFVVMFTAGILVASHVADIRRLVTRLPASAAAGLWLVAAALLLSPGPTIYRYFDFTWGVGATMLVMLTVGSVRVDRLLSVRPLVWLGRVSFSLYLIHLPLLIAAVQLANGVLPLWLTIPAVIVASLLCAEAMHRAVEIPSIRLGRVLAGRIGASRRAPAAAWPELREIQR